MLVTHWPLTHSTVVQTAASPQSTSRQGSTRRVDTTSTTRHHEHKQTFQQALVWLSGQPEPALIYASAQQETVQRVQKKLGATHAGELVETMLARLAKAAVAQGVNRIVVAGGETSGAVVQALNVQQLRIGHSIAPGVPWTQAVDRPLQLALKSGNFGCVDFFFEALHTKAPAS